MPPSHNTRGSEQEDKKPSAPEKSTQQGATLNRESNATGEARALAKSQDQSQVKAEALTGSPKSSDKQTIDSKQFSPVPQNDRSADQRGAAKSTNNESSRKGTEGGAPRSVEGAGNDTTLKSITGPKVNSEAGVSENRNRSVSSNEQSVAKSNLTELGVYKKFEGDKIDNHGGTDKAAKPEQPPQSQEGRLRRDLMEPGGQILRVNQTTGMTVATRIWTSEMKATKTKKQSPSALNRSVLDAEIERTTLKNWRI